MEVIGLEKNGAIHMKVKVDNEVKDVKVFEDMVVINNKEILFDKGIIEKYREVVDVLVNHYQQEFINLMNNLVRIEKIREGYHEVDLKINGIEVKVLWEYKCREGWHRGNFECYDCDFCNSSACIYSIIINNIEIVDILNVDKWEDLDNDFKDAIEKLEEILQRAGWL